MRPKWWSKQLSRSRLVSIEVFSNITLCSQRMFLFSIAMWSRTSWPLSSNVAIKFMETLTEIYLCTYRWPPILQKWHYHDTFVTISKYVIRTFWAHLWSRKWLIGFLWNMKIIEKSNHSLSIWKQILHVGIWELHSVENFQTLDDTYNLIPFILCPHKRGI